MRELVGLKYEFEVSLVDKLTCSDVSDFFFVNGKMYSLTSLREPFDDPLIKGLALTIIEESFGLLSKFRIGITKNGDFTYNSLLISFLN